MRKTILLLAFLCVPLMAPNCNGSKGQGIDGEKTCSQIYLEQRALCEIQCFGDASCGEISWICSDYEGDGIPPNWEYICGTGGAQIDPLETDSTYVGIGCDNTDASSNNDCQPFDGSGINYDTTCVIHGLTQYEVTGETHIGFSDCVQ